MNEKMKPRKMDRIEIPTSTSKSVLQMTMVKMVVATRRLDQTQVGTFVPSSQSKIEIESSEEMLT